jgi:hypothetical protein
MTCGVCLGSFSTKDTISVTTTQDYTLQFHTLLGAPVCNACAEEHAPEQWAVFHEITAAAIAKAEAAEAARRAELARINACINPADVIAGAKTLLALGINPADEAACGATLQHQLPGYEEERVRECFVVKCRTTARVAAAESNGVYHPF